MLITPRVEDSRRTPRLWLTRPVDARDLVHLRRARDLIDREFAEPLDVPAMARTAAMSPSHFARQYRQAYDETPYQHLLTRRVEGPRLCCVSAN